jgi:hypothetical protein
MLEKTTSKNLGSLCSIRVVEADQVSNMPDALDGVIYSAPLLDDATWEKLVFTPNSAHFVERFDGSFYNLVVKFKTPRDGVSKQQDLARLKRSRWVVELTDLNGVITYAGTPEEGCAIRQEMRDKGQNRRDSNHFNCVIMLSRSEPVPVLQA